MSEEDVTATAGLRRFVTHARDLLRASQMQPPSGDWAYGKHWSPQQIQRYAAHLMAQQALTLVLDCLPQSDVVSADEVAEMQAAFKERASALERAIADRDADAKQRDHELENIRSERDEAIEQQEQAESVEAETFERWQRAVELAQTDAAAAVRFLLDVSKDEATDHNEGTAS